MYKLPIVWNEKIAFDVSTVFKVFNLINQAQESYKYILLSYHPTEKSCQGK